MFFLSKKKKHFSEADTLLKNLQQMWVDDRFVKQLSARRIRLNTFRMHVKSYSELMGYMRLYVEQEHLFKAVRVNEERNVIDFDYFTKDLREPLHQVIDQLYSQIAEFLYKASFSPDDSTILVRLIRDCRSLIEHAEFALT